MHHDPATVARTHWHLDPITGVERATSGTMNATYLVQTNSGSVVLRGHHRPDRAWIDHELDVISHARRRGVPVPATIPTVTGDLIAEHDGTCYTLCSVAPGHQLPRSELRPAHARAMGAQLAAIHHALADYPVAYDSRRDEPPSAATALERMRPLIELVEQRDGHDELDRWALAQLRGQARWLESWLGAEPARLAHLEPVQVTHGDYQETNLFFADDEVVSVIDWDKSAPGTPAGEALRCADLSLRFDPALVAAFIAGYRTVHDFDLAHVDAVVDSYAYWRACDVFAHEAVYLRCDERARPLIARADFEPANTTWRRLRERLT